MEPALHDEDPPPFREVDGFLHRLAGEMVMTVCSDIPPVVWIHGERSVEEYSRAEL
jgi:hypothetical protein